ncbi:MAG: glycosyl transferase family 51 [Desulfofustis sp.]|nr:glycosyl transferase family 51 [Desulfofustis sp.]
MIKKIFLALFIVVLLAFAGAGAVLYYFVVLEPGEEISEENIRSILGRESPVFYSDGVTPLGAFFSEARRQYVEYQEIPETFINALVAAEDNRFFSHFGFDVQGIARAAIKNIEAGRIVQGGSTLTQQTAKNLFKRKDRSYKSKFIELIYALRLEYRYTKEDILEFYSNQFFVSGNGHGLGVAARYYFNKKPEELTLIESAYIAGSVKRPNYYNPFIKKDPEAMDLAKERGRQRVAYVLKAMLNLGMIDELDYKLAQITKIPFEKGTVGYSLDSVMELVTDAVSSERLLEAMRAQGIDNIATSGIRVITTVDKYIQHQTLYGLRKQLSTLDVRLRGYEREEVQKELAQKKYRGDRTIETGSFVFGTIEKMEKQGDEIVIEVETGLQDGRGRIDRNGLESLVDARIKYLKNRWTESTKKDVDEFLVQLQEGDRVWVSVREIDEFTVPVFDLERFPKVQGGAIAVNNGKIMSVAGGVENRFFNRAMYARRTMGSSYKPFVYSAALQLGWNAADLLVNKRDVFVFQNQPYFPRPDHEIDNELVSMSWAGVRSENVASVWLTAHLCDHLSRSQFEDVAAQLGLGPRIVDGEPEPYRLFRSRIRDRYGIVINEEVLRQAAFRKTVGSIQPDLVFEGLAPEYPAMKELHYGLNFDQFEKQIDKELANRDLQEYEKKELRLRKRLLAGNLLALQSLYNRLQNYLGQDLFLGISALAPSIARAETPYLYFDPINESYQFDYPSSVPGYVQMVSPWQFHERLNRADPFTKKEQIESIRLGDTMSVKAFEFLSRQVDSEFRRMRKLLPYSMDVLSEVEDFRILVGLKYLVEFGKFLGIESALEPILSFPLGSNVVTLMETTRLYEALVTGSLTLFREENGEINNSLAIIDRIESEDGALLFRPEGVARRAVSTKTSLVLGHILENTVKFGTGRYADREVKLQGPEESDEMFDELSLSIPLLGKTGTANRYTNASFFGYLPAPKEDGTGMVIENGFGVGVYVGYDDNQPMRRGSTRITGAAGALPAWTTIVKAIVKSQEFENFLDPVDLSFYGLAIERKDMGQKNFLALKDYGGQLKRPLEEVDTRDRYLPSIITFGVASEEKGLGPARSFAPFWLNQTPAERAEVLPTAAMANPAEAQ